HQASKAYLAQAGISILGGILGGKVGAGTAQIINAVGGLGLNALFLKYSRDIETQADVRGSQILTASGYTPADMVGFFQTLERVDPSKKTNSMASYTNRNSVYRISYPSNWQVYESNGMGVTIAPPGGVGNANGNSDIVYGAVINHYDPFGNNAMGGNISLQSATQDLVAEIQ